MIMQINSKRREALKGGGGGELVGGRKRTSPSFSPLAILTSRGSVD